MNTQESTLKLSPIHTFVHRSKRRISLVTFGLIMLVFGIWLMLSTVQNIALRELYCQRTDPAVENCLLRLIWFGVILSETSLQLESVILEDDDDAKLHLMTPTDDIIFSIYETSTGSIQAQYTLLSQFLNQEGEPELTIRQGGDLSSLPLGLIGSVLASGGLVLGILGYRIVTRPTHRNLIESVVFAPDGQRLASASWDKTIQVWDVKDLKLETALHGHTGPVVALAFSPDSTILVSGCGDHAVRLWRVIDGESLQVFKDATDAITDLAISADGQYLAAGSWDLMIYLWHIADGVLQQRIAGHEGTVESLVFTPDNQMLISASADQTIRFWRVSDGTCLRVIQQPTAVTSLAISPDGDFLASGSVDHLISIWSLPNGELQQTLDGHTDWIRDLAFSPDGIYLVSASTDGTIRFWSAGGKLIGEVDVDHSGEVTSVAVSSDSKKIATSSRDQMVRLWHVDF